jgi:hypothetical protein
MVDKWTHLVRKMVISHVYLMSLSEKNGRNDIEANKFRWMAMAHRCKRVVSLSSRWMAHRCAMA